MRTGSVRRRYLPFTALAWDSSDGVAEPRTTGTDSSFARMTATSRAW